MPLPHSSVDKFHAAAVEACMAYERACRRRGIKVTKVTFSYEPDGEGFSLEREEHPYPYNKYGNPIIPEEEREVPGEDEPLPPEKD